MPLQPPDLSRPSGEDETYGPPGFAHGDLAEFSLFARSGMVIVDARGEIDLSNAAELVHAVEDAAAQGAVVLDLTSLTFIDSTGVRALFRLGRQLAEAGTALCVVVPPGAPIRRVLTLLDLPSAVPVDESLDDALLRMQVGPASNGGSPS